MRSLLRLARHSSPHSGLRGVNAWTHTPIISTSSRTVHGEVVTVVPYFGGPRSVVAVFHQRTRRSAFLNYGKLGHYHSLVFPIRAVNRISDPVNAQFNVPSTILVAGGASQQLAAQATRLGGRRALLVTDATMVASGLAQRCVDQLAAANIPATIFSGVKPDPTDENVRDGLALLRQTNCDLVIGLGGGSPMDAAKVIAVAATNDAPLREFAGYHRIARAGLPLVCVPTTAGTGSEVTKVAVITDTKRDVKMMMLDVHLLARVALVDFELSLTMPAPLTAHVGVDTLTHGIEAFVSKKANPLTDPLALECIRLTAANLFTAWEEAGNRPAREAMMLAACLGGMAFANSSVCLVHGMSRPIGAMFHLAHGLSNALLLPALTRWSLPGAVARYAQIARFVGAAANSAPD